MHALLSVSCPSFCEHTRLVIAVVLFLVQGTALTCRLAAPPVRHALQAEWESSACIDNRMHTTYLCPCRSVLRVRARASHVRERRHAVSCRTPPSASGMREECLRR